MMKLKLRGAACALALTTTFATACGDELGNLESDQHGAVVDTVPKRPFDADQRTACGNLGLTADGAGGFARWPYLQRATDHGVDILWTAASGGPFDVEVTTPAGDLVAAVEAQIDAVRPEHTQYVARVDRLEPDTLYCYSVYAGARQWLRSTGFRTAPAPGSRATVRIAVIGDLGTQTGDQLAVRDQLENVPFELVLVVGDLAYETGTLDDHERNFFDVYRDMLMTVPFFVISGNHDYAGDGAVFREVFDLFDNGGPDGIERWYSFDWGGVHFTAIDTEVIGDTQSRWVAADLAATDQPWKIAFLHKPPFSSGWHGSNTAVQDQFAGHFAREGVQLVLAGHDHDYERTTPIDGVTYVVTGSAGRGTRGVGASDFTAYSEAVAHFTHLTVTPGRLKLNAIDAAGGDFDTVTIDGDAAARAGATPSTSLARP